MGVANRDGQLATAYCLLPLPTETEFRQMAAIKDPENTLIMETTKGKVVIALRPDLAPKHVERIKTAGARGLLRRHRLPSRHRRLHGPDRLPAGHRHRRLEVSATCRPSSTPSRTCAACARWRARRTPTAPTASSSSASTTPRFLDKQYTVWGKVIEGMENVDKIKRGEPVQNPDKIKSLKVAADVK